MGQSLYQLAILGICCGNGLPTDPVGPFLGVRVEEGPSGSHTPQNPKRFQCPDWGSKGSQGGI